MITIDFALLLIILFKHTALTVVQRTFLAAKALGALEQCNPPRHVSFVLVTLTEFARFRAGREMIQQEVCTQVITATSKTDKGEIRMDDNTVSSPGEHGEQLPRSFFAKVSSTEQGDLDGQWDVRDMPGCFMDKYQESKTPGARITFSW